LKPENTYNKICFEAACLDESVKQLFCKKCPKRRNFFGYFFFSKNYSDTSKVAQLAEHHPMWSTWPRA
jgi:hypothetical protein